MFHYIVLLFCLIAVFFCCSEDSEFNRDVMGCTLYKPAIIHLLERGLANNRLIPAIMHVFAA